MKRGADKGRMTVIRGSAPGRPRIRYIEDARRIAREALNLLLSIPPHMAKELTEEIFDVARWRAECNLALVLDAISRDERPRPGLHIVRKR